MSRTRHRLVLRLFLSLLLLTPLLLHPNVADAVEEAGAETPSDLTLHLSGGEATELRLWRDGAWEILPLAAAPEQPARVVARQGCIPGAVALVAGERSISTPWTLTDDDCLHRAPVEVRLMPRATVEGALTVAKGESLPETAELRVDRCANPAERRGAAPLGRFPLVVSKKGAWSSPAPAGCVHLTLSAGDWAAVSWWGMGLETGASEKLGARRLIAGRSVLVEAVSGVDGRGLEGARVELWPESAARELWRERGPERDPESRSSVTPVAEGATGPWGWLRLAGLEPGHYVLRLEDPSSKALTVTPAFELVRDEAVFEGLEIPQPARLEVVPTFELEALSRGWFDVMAIPTIDGQQLLQATRFSRAPAGESLVLEGLHPGLWEVRLSWRRQEVASETLTLLPGERRWLEMAVELPLYHGDIRFRGEPVKASLTFYPRSREQQVRSTPVTRPDEEGKFTVFLPGPGMYQVLVHTEDLRLVPRFEVGKPDEPLHIRLPDGRLEGRVVDGEGQPVPASNVGAMRLELGDRDLGPAMPIGGSAQTGEDGTFAVEGLADGTWELSASKGELRSVTRTITLGPDQIQTGIELVLGRPFRLTGRVRTESGQPVAQASGWLTLDPRDTSLLDLQRRFQTGIDGKFTVELAERPHQPVQIAVEAPGLPLFSVRLPPTERLEVIQPEIGGRLVLTLRGEISPRTFRGVLFQREDGSLFQSLLFKLPMEVEEGKAVITVPSLAPGHWGVLAGGSPEIELAAMAGAQVPALTSFDVVAGQTVQVEATVSSPP